MSPKLEQALPKYLQVAEHIRGLIVRGELLPGDEIPSERQIVEEWGVSRPTATKALGALRAAGLVEARQGSGTYVRTQPRLNRRARDRYARARDSGRVYVGNERSEIREADLVEVPEDVAAALGIEPGAQAIRRRRVIYDDKEPVEVSVSWFDGRLAGVAPKLLKRSRIREGTVAYVEGVTGRRAHTGSDWIGARMSTEEEAAELGLDEDRSVLVVRHSVCDASGYVLEHVEAVHPPGKWVFEQQYPITG